MCWCALDTFEIDFLLMLKLLLRTCIWGCLASLPEDFNSIWLCFPHGSKLVKLKFTTNNVKCSLVWFNLSLFLFLSPKALLLSKFPHYDHKQHIKESIINCLSEIEILDINSSTHICKIDTHQSWSKAPIFAFGTNFEEALNESLILEKLNLKCNHFRNNIKLGLKLSNVGKWTAKCLFSCPSTLAVDPITTAIQPSKRTFEQCVFFKGEAFCVE